MSQATVQIPALLVPKLEQWGKLTAEIFGELRQKEGIVPEGVPKDQEWFWSKEWQAMEREADHDIATGTVTDFDTMEDAIKHLKAM